MSDEFQSVDESPPRELEREERRLARLRLVVELHPEAEGLETPLDDPDPKEAA